MLREHYLTADMGISGGNFFVAETGSVVLVTNEGNATLTTTLPKVHVAISGIEKIVPTLEDVATLMRLLPRSATGQSISNYVDVLTGTKGEGEFHGAEHMYFILVDCGRTGVLGERRARGAALHPLRRVHEPLPGLPERRRPLVRLGLSGPDRLDPDADVRRASRTRRTCRRRRRCATSAASCARSRSRCPTCSASCASRRSSAGCGRGTSAPASRLWAWLAQRPALYARRDAARRRALLKAMGGPRRHDPHACRSGGGWTDGRDMPAPAGRTFRELYRRARAPQDDRR